MLRIGTRTRAARLKLSAQTGGEDRPSPPFLDNGLLMIETKKSIIEMRGIDKYYGGVHAVRGVDLDVYSGEVHALVGR